MVTVYVDENESIESALKRFSKKVTDARILIDVRDRQAYVKPSVKRRRANAAGAARNQKRQQKTEKYLQFLDNHKFPPRLSGPSKPAPKFLNDTVYVGGIPYNSSEDDLRLYFENIAMTKSVKIILDRDTGKSRGFGFVRMSSEKAAKEAIDSLNGTVFQGRKLVVSLNERKKKPKEEEAHSSSPNKKSSEPAYSEVS